MMYSYSWDIARDGKLSKYDESLVGVKNIPVDSQMSISLEYFLGYGYRLKEFFSSLIWNNDESFVVNDTNYSINRDFVDWVRIQLRLWISLSAGLIFLWLLILDSSFLFSALGGLLFAVAPAAIARATGQDIIRENFAIVFILCTFLSYSWYLLKKPCNFKLILLASATALALVSWDMTQLCFSLLGVYEIIIALFSKEVSSLKLKAWAVIFVTCILCGLLNPYLFSHNFIFSPLVAVIIPSLLFVLGFKNKSKLVKIALSLATVAVLLSLWFFVIKNLGFSGNYSHFYSLLLAKIRFGNVQPVDPSLLDFDSRILWTPALHSATRIIYWNLFHFAMPVFAILAIIVFSFRKTRSRLNNAMLMPVVFALFFFVLFILMVRFHALAIPFIVLSIVIFAETICRAYDGIFLRLALLILLLGVMSSDFYYFMHMERKYNDDYKTQLVLIREINHSRVKDKTILADFTLSPMLKAYCGAKIVLQPKFEMKGTRDAVERYLDIIYHGTEREFMEFCTKYAVEYFIFDKGMMDGGREEKFLHPWSTRYIANAEVIKETAPVYLFANKPETLKYFYQLDGQENLEQNRFVIFKVIYPENIRAADYLYFKAKNSNNSEALSLINEAFKLNPASPEIRYFYYTLNRNNWPELELKPE